MDIVTYTLTTSESPKGKTEVLYGTKDAVRKGAEFMRNVRNRMDISFDQRAPSIVVEIEAYRNGYIDIRKRGGKIRAITEITKDNLRYCRKLEKLVDGFRHLDGLATGIAISESEYMATTILQEAKPLELVIYSNVKEIVEQQQYIFETLWSKAIPAKRRIKEIEQDTKREFIQTVQDPIEVENLTFQLLKSATEEILILFSTANAFRGHSEYSRLIQLLKKASSRNVRIRILVDVDDPINKMVRNLEETKEQISIQNHIKSRQTKVTILVVDKTYSLTIEMKDSSARTFDEAIGLATYSNSESTVSSYISIFESIWIQSELEEQKNKVSR